MIDKYNQEFVKFKDNPFIFQADSICERGFHDFCSREEIFKGDKKTKLKLCVRLSNLKVVQG